MNRPLEDLASQIVLGNVQENVLSVAPIVNLGSVNSIFLVQTARGKYVVRLNAEDGKKRFEWESWCIAHAIRLGIPSPTVISCGEIGDVAYMVLTFVEGINGSEVPHERLLIWTQLGRYAKLYHSVGGTSFGEEAIDTRGEWQRHVTYNIESLSANDPLLQLGVLTKERSVRLRKIFEELLQTPFTFGLNHGDLSERNTIVNRAGVVYLLDWGCAEVHVVPHFELMELWHSNITPESQEFHAFLDSYGMSERDFRHIQPELNRLAALRTIDKLRWAIDKKPERIPYYAKRAEHVLSSL